MIDPFGGAEYLEHATGSASHSMAYRDPGVVSAIGTWWFLRPSAPIVLYKGAAWRVAQQLLRQANARRVPTQFAPGVPVKPNGIPEYYATFRAYVLPDNEWVGISLRGPFDDETREDDPRLCVIGIVLIDRSHFKATDDLDAKINTPEIVVETIDLGQHRASLPTVYLLAYAVAVAALVRFLWLFSRGD